MDRKEAGSKLPNLINWDLAAGTAAALAPAGPRLSRTEIEDAVAELRSAADRSVGHVYDITGLEAARDLRDSEVLIVDRASWAKANTQSFRTLLQPTLDELARTRSEQFSSAASALGGTVTGAQLGSILAFLASKVLGQYDPFTATDIVPDARPAAAIDPASAGGTAEAPAVRSGGRLLLVAPNIIAVERELRVRPSDFRLWVCLHEQTHRVQFAAAPWLQAHMMENIAQLSSGLMDKADTLAERLAAAAKSLGRKTGSAEAPTAEGVPESTGLLAVIQDPEDRAVLSHLTAVMSLLEGHANVVMDAVGPDIVPTVKTIRQRFNGRGKDRSSLEKWIRSLLGLDAKMRQYKDGSRFVRAVVDEAGMEGFNQVWNSAENLPTEAEIHQPKLWIIRMGL